MLLVAIYLCYTDALLFHRFQQSLQVTVINIPSLQDYKDVKQMFQTIPSKFSQLKMNRKNIVELGALNDKPFKELIKNLFSG